MPNLQKWLVTLWLSEDPEDFIEVRVEPAKDASEAIDLVQKLFEEFDLANQLISAVPDS